jgi:hypothetical protein
MNLLPLPMHLHPRGERSTGKMPNFHNRSMNSPSHSALLVACFHGDI